MTGQGPAVPLNRQICTTDECIPKYGLQNKRSTPTADKGVLDWWITKWCICTCGHETQPPKKGGQYGICTEYVKHGIQKTRS